MGKGKKLLCQRCGYVWNYTGESKYFTSCPKCRTSVNVKGKYIIAYRKGKYVRMRKLREEPIEVTCPRCHKKRWTMANERCLCFRCEKWFTFKVK